MRGLHPSIHATSMPNTLAFKMMPSGQGLTYRELNERSNQVAHILRSRRLRQGDAVAILLENHPCYYELAWAADRSGLYYACISSRLTVSEVDYIIGDSGARLLFTSRKLLPIVDEIRRKHPNLVVYCVDGAQEGLIDYVTERDRQPTTPVADESCGLPMLYSSGTTGRPKGIQLPLSDAPIDEIDSLTQLAVDYFAYRKGMVYLSPAPLYHTAPLRWSLSVQRVGGTVIVMEKFDAEYALKLIEEERITHAQFVPTHFVRMLKLPEEIRAAYDHSSLECVWHAAAPCPVEVKRAMIGWWGMIVREFYAATEFNGLTAITPEEWLAHPGSVGRAVFGTAHICSDDGEIEFPPRKEGLIYFDGGYRFEYHNDPEKTADAYNSKGWSALGDVGWMDEEGYLYLTDRKSFMIISGGVNLYPQEVEDVIIGHAKVFDVAVIGAPDEDLGEKMVAIIQPVDIAMAGPDLAEEILAFCADKLSRIKLPKHIDFRAELPRHPTGKLYKRLLRDEYWAETKSAQAAQ